MTQNIEIYSHSINFIIFFCFYNISKAITKHICLVLSALFILLQIYGIIKVSRIYIINVKYHINYDWFPIYFFNYCFSLFITINFALSNNSSNVIISGLNIFFLYNSKERSLFSLIPFSVINSFKFPMTRKDFG